jgi:predicted mannosyl-3-phosphoglycerate phosphatase (HAD superfamily)
MALYDLSREVEARENARYSEAMARKTGLSREEQARALHAIQGSRRDFVLGASSGMDDKAVETALANPPRLMNGPVLASRRPN